jgi:hypothetical protein
MITCKFVRLIEDHSGTLARHKVQFSARTEAYRKVPPETGSPPKRDCRHKTL